MKVLLTKEGLDKRMHLIQHIIMDCRTSVHNWERIQSPKPDERFFADHPFTRHLCGHYWFMLVTQLAKLYAPKGSHKTTFRKVLSKLKDAEIADDITAILRGNRAERLNLPWGLHLWDDTVMKEKVEELEARLSQPEIEGAVNRIHEWRDKATAHQDLTAPTEGMPSFADLKRLTRLAEEIFNYIQAGFGAGSYDLHIVGREPDALMHLTSLGEKYRELRHELSRHGIELR